MIAEHDNGGLVGRSGRRNSIEKSGEATVGIDESRARRVTVRSRRVTAVVGNAEVDQLQRRKRVRRERWTPPLLDGRPYAGLVYAALEPVPA